MCFSGFRRPKYGPIFVMADSQPPPLPDAFLTAWYDPVASLKCSSEALKLADVAGDGDFRLVAGDVVGQKLRVYRGTALSSTHSLLGEPVGLVSFYPDASIPRTPSLAVASGNAVYVYRHLRPYLKFTLPSLPMAPEEQKVWDSLKATSSCGEIAIAVRRLGELRELGTRLSSRAQDLLAIPGASERTSLLESFNGKPLVQHTVVTCLGSINRSREGAQEVSCLVVATEARQLLLLDAVGSSVTSTVDLPSVATHVHCWGVLEGDHRIYVACRDGVVYAVKDKMLMPTRVEPPTLPVSFTRTSENLLVGGMDHSLTAFAPKGTEISWTAQFSSPITALIRLPIAKDRLVDCVAVALEGGEVVVMRGSARVSSFRAAETVIGMTFGQYGREGNTLVLVLRSGGLMFNVVRRTATLEPPQNLGGGSLTEVDTPLPIPKKTRLALEQEARERDAGRQIHRSFQMGLSKLRLLTAREYLKVLLSQGGSSAMAILESTTTKGSLGAGKSDVDGAPTVQAVPLNVRVTCDVLGLGPAFTIRVTMRNGGVTDATDLALVLASAEGGAYFFPQQLKILTPVILPGMCVVEDIPVECLDADLQNGEVFVHLVRLPSSLEGGELSSTYSETGTVATGTRPLVTALVAMPQSQP